MLKELYESICSNAVKASGASLLPLPNGDTYVIQGATRELISLPNDRLHFVQYLDDFVRAAIKWCKGGTVWHDPADERVVCLLDDEQRVNRVVLQMHVTEPLKALNDCEFYTQDSFVWALRHTFKGCIDPGLLASVRVLNFSSTSKKSGAIEDKRESLGRQVDAQVTGAGDLPDTVTVRTPVYSGLPFGDAAIKCSLKIDLRQETFALVALPGELENATQKAHGDLQSRLVDMLPEIDVFCGTPEPAPRRPHAARNRSDSDG